MKIFFIPGIYENRYPCYDSEGVFLVGKQDFYEILHHPEAGVRPLTCETSEDWDLIEELIRSSEFFGCYSIEEFDTAYIEEIEEVTSL